MKLLRNLVLIEKEPEAEKTKFGLILPSNSDKAKSDIGMIVEVSPNVSEVKIGDKVVFDKWGGDELVHNDKKCVILEASKIFAIIE